MAGGVESDALLDYRRPRARTTQRANPRPPTTKNGTVSGLIIDAEPMDLRLRRPFTISRGTKTHAANVLVHVQAQGVVGLGEAAPNARYGQSQASSLEALRSFNVDEEIDPLDMPAVLQQFDLAHPDEVSARAALEMALWDWAGKHVGLPVHQMLRLEPVVRAVSSFTISIDQAQGIEERVGEASAWPVLKVKMGGGDADVKAIEHLRKITDKPFRVDANEAWDEPEAAERIPWLHEMGCELVEQPLPAGSLEAMARLKSASPVPLVADEDIQDAAAVADLAEAFHGVNVKLMKTGGIGPAIALIHAAREAQLGVMLGCMVESSVAISAAAQLAPMAHWLDLDGAALLAEDPYEGALVNNGLVQLPPRPGLGVLPRSQT